MRATHIHDAVFNRNPIYDRVKELESKITELESETDRLSRALDSQKVLTIEAQAGLAKQREESTRELHKKVPYQSVSLGRKLLTHFPSHCRI